MLHKRTWVAGFVAALMMVLSCAVRAGDATQAEIDNLKKEVEDLRRRVSAPAAPRGTAVEKALESKYGPNAPVTTKNGKLTIGGLVQVWYYTIRNDNNALFNDAVTNGIPDTNQASDNDSFRIRRTEIRLTMDIHENVTAVVQIDPAREASSFPLITDNQATTGPIFKMINNVSPEFDQANGPGLGSIATVQATQLGSGRVPRLLQDAYINYHGVVPHHDFTVGQFKPFIGEEGIRSSAQLDFVERSFVGILADRRDLGLAIHGFWWDERLQYWLAAYDGAGNFFGSGGFSAPGTAATTGTNTQYSDNRSDDNDDKDFSYRILVRPVWNNETWGSLELGMSSIYGKHGKDGGQDPFNTPVNGVNRNSNAAFWHNPWASYKPGGPVRGWWIRGEYAWIHDRNAPGSVLDVLGAGTSDSGFQQTNGKPFSVEGWFISTGYKIADSVWCDSAPCWLKPFEFAARYEKFQNVIVADLIANNHTDVFETQVITGGINYYIKGHNAKIQLNYNAIKDPQSTDPNRGFHRPDNNSLVVNFQVAF